MEPSLQPEQFWNNLVKGGAAASEAIADFTKMPEMQRDALVAQLFARAEAYVDYLIAEELKRDRSAFRPIKDDFLKVLNAVPDLLTTSEARRAGIAKVQEIDRRALTLENIDIGMTCDEVVKKLNEPHGLNLDGLKMVECASLEELKEALGGSSPPEILEKIEKEGGVMVLGIMIRKNPK